MAGKTNTESGLEERQERFCEEYLIDFNGTAAYARAGYKSKGNAAAVGAAKLLAHPKVQAYLQRRKQVLIEKTETDQEAVLKRLTYMALGDIRELFDEQGSLKSMAELTAEQASMLQGIEVFEEFEGRGEDRRQVGFTKKIKFVNRLDAAKTLGQHFGLFIRKVEHSGPGGKPIEHAHQQLGEILDLIDGADTGTGAAASRR